MWGNVAFFWLCKRLIINASNTTMLTEKWFCLLPPSLLKGAAGVGRIKVLSVLVPAIQAWSQMSLEALHGQASLKTEDSTSPLQDEMDGIYKGRAFSRLFDLYWLVDLFELLLVDWCSESQDKYSYVSSVWPEWHFLFSCHLPDNALSNKSPILNNYVAT